MNNQHKTKSRRGMPVFYSRAFRTPHSATRNRAERRGILLLVVLSLLTLFLVLGTAFIISANQYRRMNKTLARQTEAANSPARQTDLVDEVINQLVHDTNNVNSSLRYHSLLRDLYGSDGFAAKVVAPSVKWPDSTSTDQGSTGGQFLEIVLNGTDTSLRWFDGADPTIRKLSEIRNYYNGLVLTILEGEAQGASTRIVGYEYDTATEFAVLRVMAFKLANGNPLPIRRSPELQDVFMISPTDPIEVAINGRPFNGTGVGYSVSPAGEARLVAGETLDPSTTDYLPIALMPNAAFVEPRNINPFDYLSNTTASGSTQQDLWDSLTSDEQDAIRQLHYVGIGGSDESYDAVDYQNMAMAKLQQGQTPLPSFHRPKLIEYWRSRAPLASEPNLLRKVLLRPNWLDHPNFTGSNPDFSNLTTDNAKVQQMISGPWDVDNDNDGERESMWVNFGAPVVEGPNGRLVKPLAAILVVDMDGRLNLNAHGTLEHLKPLATTTDPTRSTSDELPVGRLLAGGAMSSDLPRGHGYGPADISLDPVVADRPKGVNHYSALLRGDTIGGNDYPGRYAEHDLAGTMQYTVGKRNEYDLLPQMRQQGLPQWASLTNRPPGTNINDLLGNYATPPDLRGRYGLGVNDLGQPVYEAVDDAVVDDELNLDQGSPYEMDLSGISSRGDNSDSNDAPFTVNELERVLRAYDVDAGTLQPRLWDLAEGFKPGGATTVDTDMLNIWRGMLTTDSYDLPVPSSVLPGWMRDGPDYAPSTDDDFDVVMNRPPVNLAFADLLEYRIRVGLAGTKQYAVDDPGAPVMPRDIPRLHVQAVLNQLLASDLADGLRLDINRPFGNGRDDNVIGDPGYGIVDEPGEDEGPYWEIDDTRIGTVPRAADDFEHSEMGKIRDDLDRDGNLAIVPDERGDRDGSGVVDTLEERMELHNFRRQLFARHMYVLAQTLVDPVPIPQAGVTDSTYLEKRNQRARQLAQWAINVADYRDPDNIMTAFEYDNEPFDGWGTEAIPIDGDLRTTDDIYGDDNKVGGAVRTPQEDLGGFVWGAERPELLITETLGWHDRSTENHADEDPANDENFDGDVNDDDQGTVPQFANDSTKIPDSDYDQRLRPQGAAFIELYNPWPAETAANADTHEVDATTGEDLGINLARTHTGIPDTGSPVWRLMMYRDGGPEKDPDAVSPSRRPAIPDRSVYFAGFDPKYPDQASDPNLNNNTRYVDDGVAFFNDDTRNRVPSVRPGSYMVVGSGEDQGDGTYLSAIGQRVSSPTGASRGIVLDTNANATNAVALHRNATDIIDDQHGFKIAADVDPNSATIPSVAIIDQTVDESRRFTFSEPARGYPIRIEGSRWDEGKKIYSPILDVPLDDQRQLFGQGKGLEGGGGGGKGLKPKRETTLNDGETRLMLPGFGGGGGGLGGEPPQVGRIGRSVEQASRTIPGFKWVYLQRLANPLLPWNPERWLSGNTENPGYKSHLAVNPYLTIDSSGANVTVFTGLATEERRRKVPLEPRDPIATFSNRVPLDSFSSLQRGRMNSPTSPSTTRALSELQDRLRTRTDRDALSSQAPAVVSNLWNPEAIGRMIGGAAGMWKNQAGFNGDGTDSGRSSHNFNAIPDCTLGFLNEPFRAAESANRPTSEHIPSEPFPWIAWNNRPYVSSGELLQVPKYSMVDLPRAFGFLQSGGSETYDGNTQKVTTSEGEFELDGAFPHLVNYFRTKAGSGDDKLENTVDDEGIAGLYRVLDYVSVPSPFVGTETWLNPASFGAEVTNPQDPRYLRQPPFNRISTYREPGRVNLNTVFEEKVWDGVLSGVDRDGDGRIGSDEKHPGPTFSTLADSREGAGQSFGFNPTSISNPFRSTSAADLVPLSILLPRDEELQFKEFNSSLLRSVIFRRRLDDPLFVSNFSGPEHKFRDADRNAYFRYQPLVRLANLSTTRSNVYAVWVTIGFFEVEEITETNHSAILARFGTGAGTLADAQTDPLFAKVYPDGYMLAKESGSETGDIRRLREFTIIDRSIPVAFEPGAHHNTERAIRLRRRIE